jgi:hypothetical protein
VSRGNSNKTLDQENIHVDSHAENDKGGSENESEIGEKLSRGHHENFNRTALAVGTAMAANAQIQTGSIPIRERNQQEVN